MGLMAAPAWAAQDEICAARPGKSTPACTVSPGHWQVETGLADWSLQRDGGTRDASLVVGETALRLGLTPRSEIMVDVTPWQRATSRGPGFRASASGIGDVSFAYKRRLTADGVAVEAALMPVIKLPVAKHALGNARVEAALLAPLGVALGSSPFAIALTTELDWAADADGHGHHAAMAQVASLGWQANDRLSLSAELWGQWDWDPEATTRQVSADATLAYLLRDEVQIDAAANFGLTDATPNVELAIGVSKRF
jgi:hypothetical protein